jgi:hypothetical protein
MATATERVPVLMTAEEKEYVIKHAQNLGISVGEYLRRAAKDYSAGPDDKLLEALIDQMNQATANTEKVIDETLRFVAESNRRIEKMEEEARGEAA